MSYSSKQKDELLEQFKRAKQTYDTLQRIDSAGVLDFEWHTTIGYYVVLHLVKGYAALHGCKHKSHEDAQNVLEGSGYSEKGKPISLNPIKEHLIDHFSDFKQWSFTARYTFTPNIGVNQRLVDRKKEEKAIIEYFISYFKNHKNPVFKDAMKAAGFV